MSDRKYRILIIDDEESMCEFMSILLEKEGYKVSTTTSGKEGVERVKEKNFDTVITDIKMPGDYNGMKVLEEIKRLEPYMPVIVMTAFATMETAIEAVNKGAFYYFVKEGKPKNREIRFIVKRALEMNAIMQENIYLKRQLRDRYSFDNIIGESNEIKEIMEMVNKVANTDSTVLIRGESGTGKELIAQALHYNSDRNQNRFVTVNCAALPETLLESELFGYKKGAFTGANKDKDGLFKVAHGGTLFLDEVGEMPPSIQVKLLRALQEREIIPLGDTKPVKIDVRVIAATNSDLEVSVNIGDFRSDLFYRLNVIPIQIPPLRERKDDIPVLANYFLDKYCDKLNIPSKRFSEEAIEALEAYNWPGNVRELENAIERAVVMQHDRVITPNDFDQSILEANESTLSETLSYEFPSLEELEKEYILKVLGETDWTVKEAAIILGIDHSTLHRKIKRYGLKQERNLIDSLRKRIAVKKSSGS